MRNSVFLMVAVWILAMWFGVMLSSAHASTSIYCNTLGTTTTCDQFIPGDDGQTERSVIINNNGDGTVVITVPDSVDQD